MPEKEPEPHHDPHPDKEIDEDGDMALLAKIEALRGQQQQPMGMPGMGYGGMGGMQPQPMFPMSPEACLVRGIAPGSMFVPGSGYPNTGYPPMPMQNMMGMGMGMQQPVHPFQGMPRPAAVFNHMMPQSAFPPAPPIMPTNMGSPYPAGIPVTSLPTADYGAAGFRSLPTPVSAFQGWQTPDSSSGGREEGRGRNCHKICHEK